MWSFDAKEDNMSNKGKEICYCILLLRIVTSGKTDVGNYKVITTTPRQYTSALFLDKQTNGILDYVA